MDITTLTSLINTFRAESKQDSITPDSLGQLLQRIVNVLGQASEASEVTPVTSHPFYHIECDSKKNVLYVKYPSHLITDGYVPYLLRYSKKRPRYRPADDRQAQRTYGPTMKGWHLFYDQKKIEVGAVRI